MSGPDDYGLNWPGKQAAMASVDAPTTGDLWEDPKAGAPAAAHWIIEGDNLEALKLLQPEHAGRIDVIYIDPPYNTGTDLVYVDDFRGSRRGAERSTRRTHKRTGNRHAAWLNMMAPRLILARRLLREEGAILVSIDDREVAPLRLLMDEVFGEENFEGTFVWQTKQAARGVPPRNLLIQNHEYVLCYSRSGRFRFRGHDRSAEDFSNPDDDPRGPWRSESMKATGKHDNWLDIVDPASGRSYRGSWAFSAAAITRMIEAGLVLFPPARSEGGPGGRRGVPRQKKFLSAYLNATKALVTDLGWHSTERATAALMRLFDGAKVFDFPKPVSLMEELLHQALPPGGTVLDFFAGSGTTAEAVLRLNQRDGGGRRYILVQRPEPTGRADFPTIPDLTRERVRRAGAALGSDERGQGAGFRTLRVVELPAR